MLSKMPVSNENVKKVTGTPSRADLVSKSGQITDSVPIGILLLQTAGN